MKHYILSDSHLRNGSLVIILLAVFILGMLVMWGIQKMAERETKVKPGSVDEQMRHINSGKSYSEWLKMKSVK